MSHFHLVISSLSDKFSFCESIQFSIILPRSSARHLQNNLLGEDGDSSNEKGSYLLPNAQIKSLWRVHLSKSCPMQVAPMPVCHKTQGSFSNYFFIKIASCIHMWFLIMMKKFRIHPCNSLYFNYISPGSYLRKGCGQPVIPCQ